MDEKKVSKKTVAIVSAVVILVAIVVGVLLFSKKEDGLSATTIQVLRYVGGVRLSDEKGSVTLREKMLLHNGNIMETGADGSADLMLDATKAAGVDTDSRAVFTQEDKKINIDLETGALYFYTTEKLGEEELFDITTQTMLIGVRGTSGYVIFNPLNGVSKLTLTSGEVHIKGTNPTTGGTNETTVHAGQSVQTYLYNYLKGSDSIRFFVNDITPEDVPVLLMQKIVENPAVFSSVSNETGWQQSSMEARAQAAQV
ncbi:MAG: FecR domain-containing protein, partial [Lachnospiraceae bacterium]|nr:FecR domain-containing protein [Lachnospiraceae bacterium]